MAQAEFTPIDEIGERYAEAGGGGFRPLDEGQFRALTTEKKPTVEMVKEAKRPEKTWARTIGEGILPTVGAVAGGAAGGLVTSPSVFGVPAGVLGGEMAGSALGEELNQLFGITEKSKGAVAMSALAAPAGRAIFPAAKGIAGWAVKHVAGRDIMAQAAERLLTKWMGPPEAAETLFNRARQLNFFVPTIRTPQVVDETLRKVVGKMPTEIKDQIIEAVAPLRQYFQAPPGTINSVHVEELINGEQELREIAGRAYKAGQNQLGNAINTVRGAILDDLENSGAGVVKAASRAYRKEMAIAEVSEQLGKPHPLIKISKFMKDNPLYRKAFSEPELAQIDRIAEKLAHVSASGGSGVIGQTVRGGTGFAVGGWPGVILALGGPGAVRKLLSTQFGRNYTERILGASPQLSGESLMALAVFARGMMGKPPKEEQPGVGEQPK